jgi:hypothetical protein
VRRVGPEGEAGLPISPNDTCIHHVVFILRSSGN